MNLPHKKNMFITQPEKATFEMRAIKALAPIQKWLGDRMVDSSYKFEYREFLGTTMPLAVLKISWIDPRNFRYSIDVQFDNLELHKPATMRDIIYRNYQIIMCQGL